MTLAVSLVVLAVVVGAFLVFVDRRERAWVAERRELLNRIAHPEYLPAPVQRRALPEPEPDEVHLVGAIQPAPERS